jgi:hypothetical protein
MASYTNIHNLPAAIVAAVQNDPYVGGGDISVTKLIDAPQRRVLWAKHQDRIVEDVSERIWALLGQAVHHILERADTGAQVEERLFADVEGWTLSGQFDRLHLADKLLQDYKVTTVWKKDGSEGWTQQLNVLRWLAHRNDLAVERLEIVAIFRDWRKTDAGRRADYPPAAVATIPVPVWTLDETERFIVERIHKHQAARGGLFTPCTDGERWYSGTQYAIIKPGGKKALRVLDAPPTEIPEGYEVQVRPGEFKRCLHYCEVASFCPQWQAEQAPQQGPQPLEAP